MYIIGDADKKLCQTWSSNLQQAQQARISFERQWHQNMSFYFDRQWIVIGKAANGSGFTLSEAPQSDRFRTRHTANRIKRIVRNELAQLCKEEPQFYTEPDSTEEEDRAAASAADAIAEYLIYSKYFNKRRRSATFWALMCGTSFLKNWYDEDAIELDGKPGKIDFEAVTAFHGFVPYLQEEDLQKQPWFIHARALSPEYVWNCWGVEVEPDTDVAQTLMDSRFLTSMGIQQTRNKASKMCYIKEVYVKPCKEFPNGAAFVISDDKVIYVYENETQQEVLSAQPEMAGQQMELFQAESTPVGNENAPEKMDVTGITGQRNYEFPYTHGNFPFAKIDHVATGMFYGESIIKPLIPLQKEYNRTRSIMLDTRNLAGKPQWAYQKGSIDPKHFNSKPGLLLAYNMGFEPPKPLDQPELPTSVAQDLGVTIQDMDDVSSQFEVSKGRTPPGVEAASAIAYLQEENNTILFPTIASLEEAVQETGIQVLTLVHDFWDPGRIISMTSKNNAYEVKKFSAAKLKQRSDFRVIPQSMAPRSSAARQAQIIEYMKMGIAPPEKLLGLIPMNETRTMFQMLTLDERHAQRENMKMAEGTPINVRMDGPPMPNPMMPGAEMPTPRTNTRIDPMTGQPEMDPQTGQPVIYIVTVNSWDNHQKHVEVHQNYMKTQEFELLPEQTRQVFEDHLEEHKLELAKQMMYSNQMGPSQQGSAPPPGEQPQEQTIQEGAPVA